MITLGVLLTKGQERTTEVNEFIETALNDKNATLVDEAKALQDL